MIEELKFSKETNVIDTGYVPHPFQKRIHMNLKRWSVLVCHRRFGKTVLAVNTLIDAAARCSRQDPRFAYVAPYKTQAKDVTWHLFKNYSAKIPGVKFNEQELSIFFPHNKAKIRLYGADNAEAMRGLYFDGVVLDEVADMKPDVWVSIVRPTLIDRVGWAIFIGTPKGINLFSNLYFKGMKRKDWYCAMFKASMSIGVLPWITKDELENAAEDMTPAKYRQEMECDFGATSGDVLIGLDLFRESVKREPDIRVVQSMPKIWGADVARFGGDRCTLFKRQGLLMGMPKGWLGIDNMQFAARIAVDMDKDYPDAVFIDGGRGEGVIDRLRQLGHKNIIEVNFGGDAEDKDHYHQRDAEMWDRMLEWANAGGIFPDHDELEAEVTNRKYDFDGANRLILERKKDLKDRLGFSPDYADGAALTFAQKVRPKLSPNEYKSRNERMERNKYNVFGSGRNRR